jgi:hypothetical protein
MKVPGVFYNAKSFKDVPAGTTRATLAEDQHTNNTDKTALPGTRWHARYDGRAATVIRKSR